jgi:hypothetical protein
LREGALFQRLLEGQLELLHLEGLAQEVGGTQAHGFDDRPRLPVPGEHHDGNLGEPLLQTAKRLESVDARQHHVECDDVRLCLLQRAERLLTVGDRKYSVALARDQSLHVVAHARVVIDDENAKLFGHTPSLPMLVAGCDPSRPVNAPPGAPVAISVPGLRPPRPSRMGGSPDKCVRIFSQ